MKLPLKILLLCIGCASTQCIASEVSDDLLSSAGEFYDFIRSDALHAENCAPTINRIYVDLLTKSGETYNLPAVRDNAASIAQLIWDIRLALRAKLKQFFRAGNLDRSCAEAIKTALRASRFVEEYLVLNFLDLDAAAPLSGSFPHLQVAAEFNGPQDLQSGDVLLSRGNAYTSAAIARIGDIDTQFSHLAFIFKDESNELYAIESLIELGLIVKKYREGHYAAGHARVAVYRYADSTLAHSAARYMYDLVRQTENSPESLPYDFRMDVDNPAEMYCSEVVSQGFKNASKGKVSIPFLTTEFPAPSQDFRDAIGIAFPEAFMPADIEVDPRFDLVAEWKDYTKLHDSHLKDIVLTRAFAWMEDTGLAYRFDGYWYEGGFAELLVSIRKWSWLSDVTGLNERLSQTMPPSAISIFWALDRTMEPLFDYLKSADAAFARKQNRTMIANELYQELEKLRVEDYERYKSETGDVIFHDYFRPRNFP